MALSDESDGSDGSDDYDDALSYRIAPPVAAMVGAGLGSCYFAIFALFLK